MKIKYIIFLILTCLKLNAQVFTSAFQGNFQNPLRVGDSYKGGIIAYIFNSNDLGYVSGEVHGIIACKTEIVTKWTNNASAAVINTSQNIGTGLSNTIAIVSALGNTPANSYAALDAYNYSYTENGNTYDDWFLPSYLEVLAIRKSLTIKSSGAFAPTFAYSTGTKTQAYKTSDSLNIINTYNNPLGLKILPTTLAAYAASVPRYWSSTDYSTNAAYSIRLNDLAVWNNQSKTYFYNVRFARYF